MSSTWISEAVVFWRIDSSWFAHWSKLCLGNHSDVASNWPTRSINTLMLFSQRGRVSISISAILVHRMKTILLNKVLRRHAKFKAWNMFTSNLTKGHCGLRQWITRVSQHVWASSSLHLWGLLQMILDTGFGSEILKLTCASMCFLDFMRFTSYQVEVICLLLKQCHGQNGQNAFACGSLRTSLTMCFRFPKVLSFSCTFSVSRILFPLQFQLLTSAICRLSIG